MLVQCPNCKTTYKVAEEVLKGAAPAFRCSRCRHTFELEAEELIDAPAGRSRASKKETRTAAQDQELSFSFPAKEAAGSAVHDEPPATASNTPTDNKAGEKLASQDQWSIASSETRAEAPFTIPETTSLAVPDKIIDAANEFINDGGDVPSADSDGEADDTTNILPMSSYMDQQASILPYLTLFGLLAIGFSLFAVITHAHPKTSEDLVKKIPLFGRSVLKNSHLKDAILLQSLRGGYQTIQGNREVFVITGVALNHNPVVVREIQLTGKVYNESGKELEQQTIWVGNTLSAKILRGMTAEDIPHLQSLKPLKSFEMPTGDSIPFAMVFLKATRSARDFSCEVALADGEN